MRSKHSRLWAAALLALAIGLLPAPASAGPSSLAATSIGPFGIEWQLNVAYEKLVVTVSGPEGLVLRRELAAGASPVFEAIGDDGKPLADGDYTYELVASPVLDRATRRALAAARRSGDDSVVTKLRAEGKLPSAPLVQSGFFKVAGGSIVPQDAREESATGTRRVTKSASGLTPTTSEVQVINMDLIVQGSECVGIDCTSGESFGFDTIRLKENNLRIKFEDTSVGTFPSTDWQLTANDSASGGQNRFSIEDVTSARIPFTVEGGSTTNSIYIDSTGRVGFRTSTPVLDIHVATSNTPGIRLEQNNSGGFTAQTWDIAGNEANFFVRDVTGGSLLPFRIRPGADTSSIDINADGEVGIGTASPTEELTVKSDAGNSDVVVVQNSSVANTTIFRIFETTAGDGLFSLFSAGAAEQFRLTGSGGHNWLSGTVGINCNASGGFDFGIKTGTGSTTTCNTGTFSVISAGSSTFTTSSSRSIKENLEPVRMPNILDKIAGIDVYKYDFIEGPKDRVGLMAEDFHQVFQRGSDKLINGQEVEMALWLAVQELTKQNKALAQRLEQLEAERNGSRQQQP